MEKKNSVWMDSFGFVNKLRTKTENKERCWGGLAIVFGERLQYWIKIIIK
jgi:hypothetical protein